MQKGVATVAETAGVSENNRARVRRLLFDPLGFRYPKTMTAADGQATLNAIADELSYLPDDALGVLVRMVRPHGEGSARCFWPPRATFVAYAHLVQPLRLEDDPKLLSWFASREGQAMVQDGTLVETWQYFEARRVPPYTPKARALVLAQAQENKRRLDLIEERQRLGFALRSDEVQWAGWYQGRLAHARAVLDAARGVHHEA